MDGAFATPFDPIDMGHMKKWRDYTESNAWQTTFGIQHDPAGMIALQGGPQKFIAHLDGPVQRRSHAARRRAA